MKKRALFIVVVVALVLSIGALPVVASAVTLVEVEQAPVVVTTRMPATAVPTETMVHTATVTVTPTVTVTATKQPTETRVPTATATPTPEAPIVCPDGQIGVDFSAVSAPGLKVVVTPDDYRGSLPLTEVKCYSVTLSPTNPKYGRLAILSYRKSAGIYTHRKMSSPLKGFITLYFNEIGDLCWKTVGVTNLPDKSRDQCVILYSYGN